MTVVCSVARTIHVVSRGATTKALTKIRVVIMLSTTRSARTRVRRGHGFMMGVRGRSAAEMLEKMLQRIDWCCNSSYNVL